MPNKELLSLLLRGADAWNEERQDLNTSLDLRGVDLRGVHLSGANLNGLDLTGANLLGARLLGASLLGANLREACLTGADLRGAHLAGANLRVADLTKSDLRGANLTEARLTNADLTRARLSGADLAEAHLRGANLTEVDLTKAHLRGANLSETCLIRADLTGALLGHTALGDANLSDVKGLDACRYLAPSIIDHQTLLKSGPLPLSFLRGVGLPNLFIEYIPSLIDQPIQFYSCFISYSSKDQDFADRIHADLQNKGVRCWFAPHDMQIGANIWDALDEAIRMRDKVLLILSEGAIASGWVKDEVTKAFAEERDRQRTILFPIRLDNLVLQTSEPWARKLRDQRNIGDFSRWKHHDSYQKSFDRILRDLKVEQSRRA